MAPTQTDIAIVGAGPAGTSAAITLARAGLRVLVVDRARFPRDKTCGDGLTTMALRNLADLGLDPSSVPSWQDVDRFSIRSPSGRWVRLPLPDGRGTYAAVARRSELDGELVWLARSSGAEVREGIRCTGAHQDTSGVTLNFHDDSAVRARLLIGADGMWSVTRRLLDPDPDTTNRGELHALRQYVTGVTGRARHELIVWFDPDVLPGYVWSFPLGDGGVNVGIALWRDGSYPVGSMGRLWAEVLRRAHIASVLGPDATPEGPVRAWPIPARIDRSRYGTGRVLWAGDAIGACDPMSGEGIAQALETGRWAAEAIISHGIDHPAAVQDHYHRCVTDGLVADHQMAMALVRALRHRKGVRVPLWLVDRNDWTRRNFARWLWEDYPRALVFTPRRWRRGALRGGGARFPTAHPSGVPS